MACSTTTSYLSQGTASTPTQLYAGTYVAGSVNFQTVGSATTSYNAIGYDTADHYLYAVQKTSSNLLRIDPATGAVVNLGATTPAIPATVVGALDSSNALLTLGGGGTTLAKTNLTTLTTSTLTLTPAASGLNDFTYYNGYLWGAQANSTSGWRIDPTTGIATAIALPGLASDTYGAAYTLGNGNVVFGSNSNNGVFQYSVSNPGASSPTLSLVSVRSAPSSSTNDGAACIGPGTDLSAGSSATSISAAPGATVTFTTTVTNNGDTGSSGYVLDDPVPSGFTNVSTSTPGCTVTGNAVQCDAGAVAAGGTSTVTITATAPSTAGCLNNTATVTGNEADAAPGNNSVVFAVCIGAAPTVAKAFSPATVDAGSNSTLTVTLTNPNGSTAVTGASFTDTYPAGLVNAASPSTTCPGGTATGTSGGTSLGVTGAGIAGGGSCTVTATVTVPLTPGAAGDYVNTIAAGALTTTNTPASGAAASATLTVIAPDITIDTSSSSQQVGSPGTFTIDLGNAGTQQSPATIYIADTLPPGFIATGNSDGGPGVDEVSCTPSFPTAAGATLICAVVLSSPLAAGAATGTASFTLTVVPQQDASASAINEVATDAAGSSTPPTPGPSCTTDNCAVTTTPVSTGVTLALGKTNPAKLIVGYPSDYSFTVTNSGMNDAAGATVQDALPAGVGFVSATGASCSVTSGTAASGQLLTCTVPATPVITAGGGTAGFTVTVRPTTASSGVVNRAAVDPSGRSTPPDPATCTGSDAPLAGCATTASLAVTADAVTAPAITVSTPAGTAIDSIDVRTTATSAQDEALGNPTIGTAAAHGAAAVNADGTLSYTPDTGFSGVDTFDYQLCNTGNPAACDTATVTVTVTNGLVDGPAAEGITTPQNTAISTVLTDLVAETGGEPLDPTSVVQTTAPADGSISIDATSGAVTYTPTAGYTGPDSYTVTVCDTSTPTQCLDVTVPVTVGANTVTAADETTTTPVGTAIAPIDVRDDATSTTGQSLSTPTISTAATHGTATVHTSDDGNYGDLDYTPDAGFSGLDTFGYQLCDTSTPTPVCATAGVLVTVLNGFVDGSAAGGIATAQNTAVTSTVAELVSATTGAALDPTAVTQTTAPADGAIAIDPGTGAVTYTPTAGYTGPDSYTVTICDQSVPTQCHDVAVPVTVGANTVTAADETITTPAGNPTAPLDVLTDATSSSGQPLADPTISTPALHGAATVNSDGTLTYTPDTGFTGADTFGYQLCDTSTPTPVCATATVTVTVTYAGTPAADLVTTVQPAQPSFVAGLPAAWRITITDNGPSAATDVRTTDPVPAAISAAVGTPDPTATGASCVTRQTTTSDLAALDPAHGPYTVTGYPTVVECSYPGLAVGAVLHETVSGLLTADRAPGSHLLNQVTAASAVPDPDLSNNAATAAVTTKAVADLVLTKTMTSAAVGVGDRATFTITAHNRGPSDAADVQVTDSPTGLAYVSSTPATGTFDGVTGVWQLSTVKAGATTTLVTIDTVTAPTARNVAVITASSAVDGVMANNGGSDCTSGSTGCGLVEFEAAATHVPAPVSAAPSVPLAATTTVTPTPLAATGIDLAQQLALGALLCLVGGAGLGATRRRRRGGNG